MISTNRMIQIPGLILIHCGFKVSSLEICWLIFCRYLLMIKSAKYYLYQESYLKQASNHSDCRARPLIAYNSILRVNLTFQNQNKIFRKKKKMIRHCNKSLFIVVFFTVLKLLKFYIFSRYILPPCSNLFLQLHSPTVFNISIS